MHMLLIYTHVNEINDNCIYIYKYTYTHRVHSITCYILYTAGDSSLNRDDI